MSAMSSQRRKRLDFIPDRLANELVDHFGLAVLRTQRRRAVRNYSLASIAIALVLGLLISVPL
jgi:hypothetical protein